MSVLNSTSRNPIVLRSKNNGYTRSEAPPSSPQSITTELRNHLWKSTSPFKVNGYIRSETPPSFLEKITTDQPPADDQQETTHRFVEWNIPSFTS